LISAYFVEKPRGSDVQLTI